MLIFVIVFILIKRAGNSNNFKVKKETFRTAKSQNCSRVKKTIMIEEVRLGIFLPPLTSHDIWAEAPSGYGPSCEVASRPASFTMTGGSGGTEKR